MALQQISSECEVDVFETQDIGGTDYWTAGLGATAGWVDMAYYDLFYAQVAVGATWNAADQLDELHLEQATTAIGGGAKEVCNIDQVAANTAGEIFVLELKSEDLDVDGGFHYVRAYCSEGGNTGTDNVSITYVRANCRNATDDLVGATQAIKA